MAGFQRALNDTCTQFAQFLASSPYNNSIGATVEREAQIAVLGQAVLGTAHSHSAVLSTSLSKLRPMNTIRFLRSSASSLHSVLGARSYLQHPTCAIGARNQISHRNGLLRHVRGSHSLQHIHSFGASHMEHAFASKHFRWRMPFVSCSLGLPQKTRKKAVQPIQR